MYNQLITTATLLALSLPLAAELAQLSENDLGDVSAQAGLTISARAELEAGTRVSYSNDNISASQYNGSDYTGSGATWLVVDDITGVLEFTNLDVDIISGVGPLQDKTAIQLTLPDALEVKSLKTKGLYLGDGPEVSYDGTGNSDSHLFLLGLELDGRLSMPAATKVNIFPVE